MSGAVGGSISGRLGGWRVVLPFLGNSLRRRMLTSRFSRSPSDKHFRRANLGQVHLEGVVGSTPGGNPTGECSIWRGWKDVHLDRVHLQTGGEGFTWRRGVRLEWRMERGQRGGWSPGGKCRVVHIKGICLEGGVEVFHLEVFHLEVAEGSSLGGSLGGGPPTGRWRQSVHLEEDGVISHGGKGCGGHLQSRRGATGSTFWRWRKAHVEGRWREVHLKTLSC